MLKMKLLMVLGISLVGINQGAFAETPTPKTPQYNDHPAYNFHGEIDKTDIYAIPLDNSEEEQNAELSEFEKESAASKK